MKTTVAAFWCACALLVGCAVVDEPGDQVVSSDAALAATVPIGMNLSEVNYYASQMPFDDVFQNHDLWMSTDGTTWDTAMAGQIPVDASGYPLQIPSQGQMLQTAVFRPLYNGDFTVTWDGDGDLWFQGGTTSNLTANSVRLTVQHQDIEPVFLRITRSNVNNHLRNITFTPLQSITADFNQAMSGFRVLRFMDWGRTNGNSSVHWSDRTLPGQGQGTERGVAIETMIATANRFKADFWYNVPAKADDDFVQHAATLIHDTLDPSLKVYVEYSNENWNGIFSQADWQRSSGVTASLNHVGDYQGPDNDESARYWAGIKYSVRRAAAAHAAFRTAFSTTPSRVVAVVGGQSDFADVNNHLLDFYNQTAINPLAGQPSNHVDALAVAPYFGKSYGDGDNVANLTVQQILNDAQATLASMVGNNTAANKTIANNHNVALIAYEAGQTIQATGSRVDDAALVAKLIAANRSPQMADLYVQAHNLWASNGGGLILYFNSCETPSKAGSWGAFEYQNQPLWEAPKAAALQALRTPDRLVVLRAKSNQRYVTADSAGNAPLVNRSTTAGAWEKFVLITNVDGTVSLKADVNRLYVTADNAGALPLIANRSTIGPWEKFQLVRSDDGSWVLRSIANSKFVTFDINGTTAASARATVLGDWEKFAIVDVGTPDRVVAFRAKSNQRYVTADSAGNAPLVNRATSAGPWEKYILITNMDGTVSVKAQVNDRYVTAESAGAQPLIANRNAIGPWEKFQLEASDPGYFVLRSIANSKLVTFDTNGTTAASARASAVGDWEKFTIVDF